MVHFCKLVFAVVASSIAQTTLATVAVILFLVDDALPKPISAHFVLIGLQKTTKFFNRNESINTRGAN